jgi:hypothetical protein
MREIRKEDIRERCRSIDERLAKILLSINEDRELDIENEFRGIIVDAEIGIEILDTANEDDQMGYEDELDDTELSEYGFWRNDE